MSSKLVTTIKRYVGLSTDTKPTSVRIGSTFFEFDTQHLYHTPDGTNWVMKNPASQLTAVKTINLNQAAGDYSLFTATTQDCFVDFLGIYVPVDVSDGSATSISIQTDSSPATEFISSTAGAKANLTAGAILTYSGPEIVSSTEIIQLTIAGAATGTDCTCNVFVSYRAVVDGGYFAIA